MRYMKIETLISAGGAIFGEVKSAAGAKMLTPIALRGDKKLRDICFLN